MKSFCILPLLKISSNYLANDSRIDWGSWNALPADVRRKARSALASPTTADGIRDVRRAIGVGCALVAKASRNALTHPIDTCGFVSARTLTDPIDADCAEYVTGALHGTSALGSEDTRNKFTLLAGILSIERKRTLAAPKNALTIQNCTIGVVETGGIEGATDATARPTSGPRYVSATTVAAVPVLGA